MKNFTRSLEEIYLPIKALLLYQHHVDTRYYLETFDIDQNGRPINARPLTIEEAAQMATVLQSESERQGFLQFSGLLPCEVLSLNYATDGCVIWHTPPRKTNLFFVEKLGIPSGKAWIPSLLWKASKKSLRIYALAGKARPTLKTPMYQAPFFNIGEEGLVCMGTVDIEISATLSLVAFMKTWEAYFFQSYFSHLLGNDSPVKGNIVQLWQEQIKSGKRFPEAQLKKHSLTLKKILP